MHVHMLVHALSVYKLPIPCHVHLRKKSMLVHLGGNKLITIYTYTYTYTYMYGPTFPPSRLCLSDVRPVLKAHGCQNALLTEELCWLNFIQDFLWGKLAESDVLQDLC